MRKQWLNMLKRAGQVLLGMGLTLVVGTAFAQQTAPTDLSGLVANVQTGALIPVLDAIISISYLAGVGFVVASIFKFKAHKDNPTQIPIGTPITLLLVGIALLFFPSIIKVVMGSLGLSAGKGLNTTGDPGLTAS